MKHVIVIYTLDEEAGGKLIDPALQHVLIRAVEIGVEDAHGPCFTRSRFNVSSATAAVHEMYNLPPWDPETGTCGQWERNL